jgi:predicted dehydrogenase
MAQRPVGMGVIGLGMRCGLADRAHDPGNGTAIAAAADNRESALEAYCRRRGRRDLFLTTDYTELLARADIGAVFITSPDFCHEEQAIAALRAGKAVYLEKPMAITIEGCDRILRAAFETRQKLYLGHNMRHMAFTLKMKELIDKGAIGAVKAAWCRHFISYGGDAYFKDWHAERSKSTGLLLQKGTHDIDIIHWLCGAYTTEVNAMGALTLYDTLRDRHGPAEYGDAAFNRDHWPPRSQKGLNPLIEVEDLSMMHMRLDNGVLASYQQCHFTPDAWRNYTIIGERGRIENFGDFMGACSIRVWDRRTDYSPDGDECHYCAPESGGHGGADEKIVDEFLRFIKEGGKVRTSPVAARNSVAAGFMATMSLRNGGKPFQIPPADREIEEYFAQFLL